MYGKPDSGLTCLNLVWPTEVDNGAAPRLRGRRCGMIYANLDGPGGLSPGELGELFWKMPSANSMKIWLRLDA